MDIYVDILYFMMYYYCIILCIYFRYPLPYLMMHKNNLSLILRYKKVHRIVKTLQSTVYKTTHFTNA